ncbi:MAG TPA: hypothetical protein VLO11_14310, partial [Luteolibacter sp.]|nr:hypothetical protein [Luteolibacter sp.]
ENEFWMDLPGCCDAKPDAFGDEHEVWFVGERVYKLAYPNFYGLRVIYRPDGDPRCLPHEYFERWNLHNGIFGDQVEIVGAVDFTDGIRLVMVQEAVAGSPAEPAQIQTFFESTGWKRFSALGETAWFDPARSVVVSDTHQGNLILTPDGILAPIDFRIQRVAGALKDAVLSLIHV